MTKYYEIWKNSIRRPTGQPNINAQEYSQLPIPIFSDTFQKSIEDMVLEAHSEREKADTLTKEANTLLEKELGIYCWTPSKPALNTSIRTFSATKSANRIDAEYYQPRYDEILERIQSKWELKTIEELKFELTTGEYVDEYLAPNDGTPYLRGTDIEGMIFNSDKIVSIDPTRKITKRVNTGDILVTRVGTIGLCAYIDSTLNQSVYSDNLIRIRFNQEDFNPQFLACYLNLYGSQFMIQLSRGSVQQRLNQETLKELYIPIIDRQIQEQIAAKITDAHHSRQKAKQLLEKAKHTVEHAIENGE